MYESHFGLKERPFSIAPDPRYIYLSDAHEDALAHLLYGVQEGGGFALLSGEVGTGKTTLLRTLVQQLPEHIDLALVFNPMLSPLQFVATVCDELKIPYDADKATLKSLIDALNKHLLESYLAGRRTILIIDEAQSLSVEVLEQVRLLTNLETTREKLLQIILIGQPELRETLARNDMRQLAQRITDVFHLEPLGQQEVRSYLTHRLTIAGAQKSIFSDSAVRAIYRASGGVPRLVNELADKAMLAAYAREKRQVDGKMVRLAAHQVLASREEKPLGWLWGVTAAVVMLAAVTVVYLWRQSISGDPATELAAASAPPPAAVEERPATAEQTQQQQLVTAVEQVSEDLPLYISNGISMPYVAQQLTRAPAGEPARREAAPAVNSLMDAVAAVAPPLPQPAAAGRQEEIEAVSDVMVASLDSPVETVKQPMKEPAALNFDQWVYDHGEQTTRESALRELASVWDVEIASGDEACSEIQQHRLRCLQMNGSWAMVNEINRPLVVQLRLGDQRSHYVTLLGSVDDSVVIRADSEILHFPREQLSARWFGEFELIWQEPPMGYKRAMRPGDRGRQIEWLRERLEEITGEEIPPENGESLFDERLAEAVRHFQASNHLVPDAMVGTQTIIRLNTASPSNSGPRLKVRG